MNDCVMFTMLYCQKMIKQGYIINCSREQLNITSKLYDEFCEEFYKGTIWEYDMPDHTELIIGMDEFISKNID